jgi:ABC-type branched-subunit amino acid transport system substrate-binding protein
VALLLAGALVPALAGACTDDDAGADDAAREREHEAITALRRVGDADPSCRAQSDGVLRIGGLLAQTGQFGAILGAPQLAGANLAVHDVNEAGGALGQPVALAQLDPGETTEQAETQVRAHLEAGVDAVLGGSTSQVALGVVDNVTEACTVLMSPANTSPELTTIDDGDLYFRTAPTDVLQGRVLANTAIRDGVTSAAILARDDAYGNGLREFIAESFEEAGAEVVVDRAYDPDTTGIARDVQAVVRRDPQALFLVGFAESAALLQELMAAGFTPDTKRIYLVEGNMSAAFAEGLAPGTLQGVKGTIPGAPVSAEFRFRLLGQDRDLPAFTFGPEAYDAVVVLALAAESAGSDQADRVARHVNGVTRQGTKCTSFAQCRDLLAAGQDIDYDGQSGPLDFARPGEPAAATYGIYPWTGFNTVDHQAVEYVDVSL